MKFLCDRCKTRYSIGDERVRGKILKIRCKNCANVITVREGMPDADSPANAGMPRRNKTTTAAPLVAQAEAIAPVAPNSAYNGGNKNALGAAFASAMTKPAPAALEEEWYVSIDGDQSGPFSLAEAQQWVAGKPFDAELHCWSEGFDDWLPVDKVSHFRGLRKKPAPPPMPAAPPPIPRVGTGPARAITAAPARAEIAARIPQNFEENTPKPLFAATMASLEKSASQPTAMAGMAAVGSAGAAVQARAAVPAVTPVTPGSRPTPYVNGITARGAALPTAKPAMTAKGVGLAPLAAKHAFDSSELAGATKVEVPAFTDAPPDEPPTVPAPHLKSVDKLTGPNDAFLDALATARDQKRGDDKVPALSLSALADAKRAEEAAPEPPDDDLDIGEVSRVVNLADIARTPKPAAKPTNQTGAINRINQTGAVNRINQTGPVGRLSGSMPRINGTAPVPLMDAVDAVPGNVMPMPAEPAAEPSSKRGLIVLMICAALLLGGAAVVVIKMLGTTDDVTDLGGNYVYNGERPDDPVSKRIGDPNGSAVEPPPNPYLPPKPKPRPQPIPNGGSSKPDVIEPKGGDKLRSDEIESMAGKSAATTTACFRRADKGADAIRLADVKKIRVAFKVNADGSVDPGSVDLSEKSSATLTSCIQRMIGGWKFRANPGGNFGFVFAKPD